MHGINNEGPKEDLFPPKKRLKLALHAQVKVINITKLNYVASNAMKHLVGK